MNQTSERIEKHLYKRTYQTAHGEWTTNFYVCFTDWKGVRRTFPVGSKRKTAKDELAVYEARNIRREDFDLDKKKAKQGITFAEWAAMYFKDKVDPDKRKGGVDREHRSCKKLEDFFGDFLLPEINRAKINEYRLKRLQEPIIRRGKVVEGSRISFPTANRELAFLRFLLNLAAEEEILEAVPAMKLPSEASRRRTRTVDDEEYAAILGEMQRPQQRYLICLNETSMRLSEPQALTWDMVDLKRGLIRLPAELVKEKWPRRTPITWELRRVLEELKEEQKRLPNVANKVFTRKGKPIKSIRKAFELAVERAEIENKAGITPHAFRRTAITRWTALGIPRDIVMAASGHKPKGVHDGYINFSDQQLTTSFADLMQAPEKRQSVTTRSTANA